MKVLIAHDYYQLPGGEDRSFETEVALLRDHGHEVLTYTVHNDALHDMGALETAGRTLWNRQVHAEILELVKREQPAVAHFNNTFPLLSPSAYYAARRGGAAVVQSLRNYRLTCVNGLLFRDGEVCQLCLGKGLAWQGVRHACYRDSHAASAVAAGMLTGHRLAGTWRRVVDQYIALSDFAARLLTSVVPADRLTVKANAVHPDPGVGAGLGGYALYAGRLSPEKGIGTLLDAWAQLPHRFDLRVFGDGPLRPMVESAAARDSRIKYGGHVSVDAVGEAVDGAGMVLFVSEVYEAFPRAIVESFARGTPVVASRLGTAAEAVTDGVDGLAFTPGDPTDLARQIGRLLDDPAALVTMRGAARRTFEQRYGSDANHRQLMDIYRRAIEVRWR